MNREVADPPRVLIADDNREIRELLVRILQQDGYAIEAVDDGNQAIEKITGASFDAILLDFMMPLVSGFDVIKWIEENRPDVAKGCVIIITAAIRDLTSFDTSTVFAAIRKPFEIAELRDTVRACVEAKVAAAS